MMDSVPLRMDDGFLRVPVSNYGESQPAVGDDNYDENQRAMSKKYVDTAIEYAITEADNKASQAVSTAAKYADQKYSDAVTVINDTLDTAKRYADNYNSTTKQYPVASQSIKSKVLNINANSATTRAISRIKLMNGVGEYSLLSLDLKYNSSSSLRMSEIIFRSSQTYLFGLAFQLSNDVLTLLQYNTGSGGTGSDTICELPYNEWFNLKLYYHRAGNQSTLTVLVNDIEVASNINCYYSTAATTSTKDLTYIDWRINKKATIVNMDNILFVNSGSLTMPFANKITFEDEAFVNNYFEVYDESVAITEENNIFNVIEDSVCYIPLANENGELQGNVSEASGASILVNKGYVNDTITNAFTPGASEGLEYALNQDGTYTLTGIGTCSDTNLIIPAFYNGKKVTIIGDDAFNGNGAITSVKIPDTIVTIGERAFADCISLTDCTIGNNVSNIGFGAFAGCGNLNSIVIPASVETMGSTVFTNSFVLGFAIYCEAPSKPINWNDGWNRAQCAIEWGYKSAIKDYVDAKFAEIQGSEVTKDYIDSQDEAVKTYADGLYNKLNTNKVDSSAYNTLQKNFDNLEAKLSSGILDPGLKLTSLIHEVGEDRNPDPVYSDFSASTIISGVPHGKHYFITAEIKQTSGRSLINTFPLYLPIITADNNKIESYYVLTTALNSSNKMIKNYLYISGTGSTTNNNWELRFNLGNVDLTSITSVTYMIH